MVITFLPPLDRDAERHFDVEASHLIRLRHPSIASLLAYGSEKHIPYVVQEFVKGQSLQALLDANAPTLASPMSVLRQLAAALDYAHAAGLVHGDLQPDAIVLDQDGRAVITGLGLRALGVLPAADGPSVYRAPEHARSSSTSAAADRYSFAALAAALMQRSAHDQVRADELDRVLVRGLASDPSARWPSCTELVEALAAAMQPSSPVVAARSNRGVWVAIAAVALVSVLALLLVLSRPPSEPSTASAAPAAMTLSRTTALPGSSLVVSGANLPGHQDGTVQFESRSQQLAAFTADASGGVTVTVVVPTDSTTGDHTVALCWENTCPLKQGLAVVPSPTPSPSASQAPSSSPSPSSPSTPTATPTASPSP